jgi:hypothetical protein
LHHRGQPDPALLLLGLQTRLRVLLVEESNVWAVLLNFIKGRMESMCISQRSVALDASTSVMKRK